MDVSGADFDSLFPTLFPPAYNVAYKLLGDPHEAQDAASEALARALADWRRVSELPHLRGWVLRVTANVAVDMLRRRRATPDSDRVADALVGAVGATSDPDARVALAGALARLPRRQLEVVVLRFLVDFSERDVAASLGITLGSVKRHTARGLERLRRALSVEFAKEACVAH